MALADQIRDLAARTVSALDGSHDYYTFSKRVWRLLEQIVGEGRKLAFRNPATGTRVDEEVLLDLAQGYVADFLVSSTFQHFVALFEDFSSACSGPGLPRTPAACPGSRWRWARSSKPRT